MTKQIINHLQIRLSQGKSGMSHKNICIPVFIVTNQISFDILSIFYDESIDKGLKHVKKEIDIFFEKNMDINTIWKEQINCYSEFYHIVIYMDSGQGIKSETNFLGWNAGYIPFSNHNSGPRIQFQVKQMKQAFGMSTLNKKIMSTHLSYLQKNCVDTFDMKEIIPYGFENSQNAIVAITTFSGYNQEDAIVMNKGSIDRGLFRFIMNFRYKIHVAKLTKRLSHKIEEFLKCKDLQGNELRKSKFENDLFIILFYYSYCDIIRVFIFEEYTDINNSLFKRRLLFEGIYFMIIFITF